MVQSANPNSIRDHLANERTLLAWVRTCIAMMGLGFVVARFGLLIRELGPNAPRPGSVGLSTGLGIALVVCGAALMVLAAWRYRAMERAIQENRDQSSPVLGLVLCVAFVAVAALLVLYLVEAA